MAHPASFAPKHHVVFNHRQFPALPEKLKENARKYTVDYPRVKELRARHRELLQRRQWRPPVDDPTAEAPDITEDDIQREQEQIAKEENSIREYYHKQALDFDKPASVFRSLHMPMNADDLERFDRGEFELDEARRVAPPSFGAILFDHRSRGRPKTFDHSVIKRNLYKESMYKHADKRGEPDDEEEDDICVGEERRKGQAVNSEFDPEALEAASKKWHALLKEDEQKEAEDKKRKREPEKQGRFDDISEDEDEEQKVPVSVKTRIALPFVHVKPVIKEPEEDGDDEAEDLPVPTVAPAPAKVFADPSAEIQSLMDEYAGDKLRISTTVPKMGMLEGDENYRAIQSLRKAAWLAMQDVETNKAVVAKHDKVFNDQNLVFSLLRRRPVEHHMTDPLFWDMNDGVDSHRLIKFLKDHGRRHELPRREFIKKAHVQPLSSPAIKPAQRIVEVRGVKMVQFYNPVTGATVPAPTRGKRAP